VEIARLDAFIEHLNDLLLTI